MKIICNGLDAAVFFDNKESVSGKITEEQKQILIALSGSPDNDDVKNEIYSIFKKDIPRASREAMEFDFYRQELKKLPQIEVQGDRIFLRDNPCNFPMPLTLIKRLAEEKDNISKVEAYINFWRLCCMNPNSEARENLIWFLDTHEFCILRSGLFVAYRYVDKLQEEKRIDWEATSVYSGSKSFIKDHGLDWCREVIKKAAETTDCNFKYIYPFEDLELRDSRVEMASGTSVQDIIDTLANAVYKTKNIYTDRHTRTMRFALEELVKMDRSECDESSGNSCSKGLHNASLQWIIDNTLIGTTPLMTIINPASIVAVPPVDNYGKLRSCEYIPVKEFTGIDEIKKEGLHKEHTGLSWSPELEEQLIKDFGESLEFKDYVYSIKGDFDIDSIKAVLDRIKTVYY